MRCEAPPSAAPSLPPGYRFCLYEEGLEHEWAALEYTIGDFTSAGEALRCFIGAYGQDLPALKERCGFIRENASGRAVSACNTWYDTREGSRISSLSWLVTHPACQGLGLGRAMLLYTMERYRALGGYPVYLHTQPWSYRAIWLYHQAGFHLCKEDTFGQYPNDYPRAVEVLRGLLNPVQLAALQERAVS